MWTICGPKIDIIDIPPLMYFSVLFSFMNYITQPLRWYTFVLVMVEVFLGAFIISPEKVHDNDR